MTMLPQSFLGQMDREIQTRPPAERQSQLPKYLLSRVCTTINVNSSPRSAAYVRRWIGWALLQIMVCRLFGTKPLSGQKFCYSQELSPGPLVYRNKLQWNFNQNRKLFFHGNASEYIVCEMAAILSRGDGLTERELSMLSDHRNAFSILMFGLIFTSFIGTFYRRSQWHWIKYLNIIGVMVWFSLATITWAKGNQYFICCYKATMNSSASAWSVLWDSDKGRVHWVNWLRKYIWKIYQLSEVGLKWLIYFAANLAVSSKKLYL